MGKNMTGTMEGHLGSIYKVYVTSVWLAETSRNGMEKVNAT